MVANYSATASTEEGETAKTAKTTWNWKTFGALAGLALAAIVLKPGSAIQPTEPSTLSKKAGAGACPRRVASTPRQPR